jgi:hypothetical protein
VLRSILNAPVYIPNFQKKLHSKANGVIPGLNGISPVLQEINEDEEIKYANLKSRRVCQIKMLFVLEGLIVWNLHGEIH